MNDFIFNIQQILNPYLNASFCRLDLQACKNSKMQRLLFAQKKVFAKYQTISNICLDHKYLNSYNNFMLDKTHFQFQYHVTIANRIFFLQKTRLFWSNTKKYFVKNCILIEAQFAYVKDVGNYSITVCEEAACTIL